MIVPSGVQVYSVDLQPVSRPAPHNGNAAPGEQPRSVNDVSHIVRTPTVRALGIAELQIFVDAHQQQAAPPGAPPNPVSRTDTVRRRDRRLLCNAAALPVKPLTH